MARFIWPIWNIDLRNRWIHALEVLYPHVVTLQMPAPHTSLSHHTQTSSYLEVIAPLFVGVTVRGWNFQWVSVTWSWMSPHLDRAGISPENRAVKECCVQTALRYLRTQMFCGLAEFLLACSSLYCSWDRAMRPGWLSLSGGAAHHWPATISRSEEETAGSLLIPQQQLWASADREC